MGMRRIGEERESGLGAVGICVALFCTAFALPATPVEAQTGDEDEARAVVEGFKSALRAGDGEAAMARLHPDVQVFEGGHAETLEEYRGGHLGADMSFLSAVETETTWEKIDVEGDLALYLSRFHTTGTFREREIDARGTETMVLRRTGEGWRIVHIHWSSR